MITRIISGGEIFRMNERIMREVDSIEADLEYLIGQADEDGDEYAAKRLRRMIDLAHEIQDQYAPEAVTEQD